MATWYARQDSDHIYSLGNDTFRLVVGLDGAGQPVMRSLVLATQPDVERASPSYALAPVLTVEGSDYAVPEGNLRFERFELAAEIPELRLHFASSHGLRVTQHFKPSPDKPVWRSWVTLHNPTGAPIGGITRFDAANYAFSLGAEQPWCGYVLGWLEGPRADAPGHPSLPYKYGGWIPQFLYGEDARRIPPPPAGGWAAPVYRLVQERLTRLPLRSGKRSTYENHPWVTLLDPARQGGWFLGFEWSGTWKIDLEHRFDSRFATVTASSDANTHTLVPGQTLVSPVAFLGLFTGDWDDAFNACRYYVDDEIVPKIDKPWPTTLHVYTFHNQPDKRDDEFLRQEMAAAARLGFESTYIETIWWNEGALQGDFSLGLGDFADSRVKFPMGLRGVSDYVHSLGMNMGLWFEIERVDLRTANRLRNPWKPEWLVQQSGYPYRSWCQHAFLLCLGVRAAANWALENLLWAVKEYNLDYIMFDSNEWAVCDDPTHDHDVGDGEWAQTRGFYYVMEELRKEYPHLMIMNSSGGSQRGDFAIARYSNCIHPHDNAAPSAKQRRFMHGTGCMYPTSYQANVLPDYTDTPSMEGFIVGQPRPPERVIGPQRFEWRVLNRLLGYFAIGLEANALPTFQQDILKKALVFYKRIRHCTHGDRYVLAGPQQLYEPRYEEADNWEAYQHIARDGQMSVIYCYRCMSQEDTLVVKPRGLDPQAVYRADSYSGSPERDYTGAELMERGIACRLPHTRSADILVLARHN